MPRPTTLGRRLRRERERLGLSGETLAQLAAVGRSTVWRIETGVGTAPSAAVVSRIAVALGVTVEHLLHGGPA